MENVLNEGKSSRISAVLFFRFKMESFEEFHLLELLLNTLNYTLRYCGIAFKTRVFYFFEIGTFIVLLL